MILITTILLIIMGVAHTYLGEKYILIRLAQRDNLPKILGSSSITLGTLRFVWHLTTIAWGALAFLLYSTSHSAISNDQILLVIGIAALISALLPLYFTRGKHLSWLIFVIVGTLVLASRAH